MTFTLVHTFAVGLMSRLWSAGDDRAPAPSSDVMIRATLP